MEQEARGHGELHRHTANLEELLAAIPTGEQFLTAAEVFGLLSDGTRLRILWLLCHAEECVTDIAAAVDMSAPAVSHHLRTLRQSGLIVSRREGREVLYTLAATKEAGLVHDMIDDMFEIHCGRKRRV